MWNEAPTASSAEDFAFFGASWETAWVFGKPLKRCRVVVQFLAWVAWYLHPRAHTGRDVSFLDGAGEVVHGGGCGRCGAPARSLGAGIDDGSEQ